MEAVIIDARGEIVGLLNDEIDGHEVKVAGAIAIDGSPVSWKDMKVSRSARNLERAKRSDAQFALRHEHRGSVFYTL